MNLYDLFILPYQSYSVLQITLEVLATCFGIISVYFSIKKNILVYPTGIVSTGLYVYILFKFGLLGESLINLYYTLMSIYGWFIWSKSNNQQDNTHIKVEKATAKDWQFSAILFVFSLIIVCIIYYYKPFIDSGFVMDNINLGWHHLDWANWMDVFTTSIFLVGMWLMARRKVENWIFWIIGDIICIPMMLYKELGVTSIQYVLFTVMAIIGYIEWKKTYKDQIKNADT